MAFLILMSAKISITDICLHKIRNFDLVVILIYLVSQRRCHLLLIPILIIALGVSLQRSIGSGDSKLLAIVAFSKCDQVHFYKSLTLILFLASLISLVYLLKYRTSKTRIPLGPALSVGLIL